MTGQIPIEPATLRRIRATNLLSFGTEGIDLELSALNVLIGPNGSGKIEPVGGHQAAASRSPRPGRSRPHRRRRQ